MPLAQIKENKMKKCYICDNEVENLLEKFNLTNSKYNPDEKDPKIRDVLSLREFDVETFSFYELSSKYTVPNQIASLVKAGYEEYASVFNYINLKMSLDGHGIKPEDETEKIIFCEGCWKARFHGGFENIVKDEISFIEEGFLFNKKSTMFYNIDFEQIKTKKDIWKEKAINYYSNEINLINKQKKKIIDLLKLKSIKMSISDITAHIKHDERDEVKSLLEDMHNDGQIDFAGNGRYFILSEKENKPKSEKTSAPKSEEVDVEKELEKLKGLLDKGLITQEVYDAKMNQILGL
tara:strand:- start:83 stop:961 length:879 start_codon:yes stop_codon:yes gene_type:complete